MRETLRELDIKISELASYLRTSRPTMYKYIDAYETGDRKSIAKPVYDVFSYIDRHKEVIGKNNVINYILRNYDADKLMDDGVLDPELSLVKKLKSHIAKKGMDNDKTAFIRLILSDNHLDKVIPYLVEIHPLLAKEKLSVEEKNKLEPIMAIYRLKGISIEKKTMNSKGGKQKNGRKKN